VKIRVAIAALAVVAMIGVAATTADAQCKGQDTKPKCQIEQKQAGCKADCKKACCADKHKQAGCKAAQAKAGCKATCKSAQGTAKCSVQEAKACCPEKICDKTEAECTNLIHKHWKTRGWLGIEMSMDGTQPVITHVVANSPAGAAGFKVDDTLTSVNGIAFGMGNDAALDELSKNGFKVGNTVVYTVSRDREIRSLNVTLGRISDDGLNRMIAHHNSNMVHKDMAHQKMVKVIKRDK